MKLLRNLFWLIFIGAVFSQNLPFKSGEKLTYEIYFRFIPAGKTTLEITLSDSNWVIQSRTNSTGLIDKIYPVRDQLISTIDKDGLFTLKYEKNISEGKYKRNYHAEMHYQDSVIRSSAGDVPVNAPVFDLMAMIYFLRSIDLSIGKEYSFRSFDNNKITPITMKIFEKKEIKTKLGVMPCFILKPSKLQLDKKSKIKGGLEVWISDTPEHLPVMIKSDLLFGSMDAKLVEIQIMETNKIIDNK
ncbi:DUF3108 domain-containing protein [bacterium]|nr:DUF3108 domain-containing protein [bacterium]MBL7052297.1 DUF3108 domain-containing protein [Candidatus Neomarinimicrobiota bacterium]